jgi:hypothetical protein
MNHKQFFKKIDEEKKFFDLDSMLVLTEQDYDIYPIGYPKIKQSIFSEQSAKNEYVDMIHGEVDRAYINSNKNYAYVIEYKNTENFNNQQKARKQCNKAKQFIYQTYNIDYDRIFCFEAFGVGKNNYHIRQVK